jgi:hypothetical protein
LPSGSSEHAYLTFVTDGNSRQVDHRHVTLLVMALIALTETAGTKTIEFRVRSRSCCQLLRGAVVIDAVAGHVPS